MGSAASKHSAGVAGPSGAAAGELPTSTVAQPASFRVEDGQASRREILSRNDCDKPAIFGEDEVRRHGLRCVEFCTIFGKSGVSSGTESKFEHQRRSRR